jgi:hypothetical protein
MGPIDRESMATSALSLGGIPIKSTPIAIALTFLALATWAAVAAIADEAEIRWVIASVGAAITVSLAAMTSIAVKVIGIMLAGLADRNEAAAQAHAGRVENATQSHCMEMKTQVISLNWLTTSQALGKERARLDADHFYGTHGQSDTGPFTKINGG